MYLKPGHFSNSPESNNGNNAILTLIMRSLLIMYYLEWGYVSRLLLAISIRLQCAEKSSSLFILLLLWCSGLLSYIRLLSIYWMIIWSVLLNMYVYIYYGFVYSRWGEMYVRHFDTSSVLIKVNYEQIRMI